MKNRAEALLKTLKLIAEMDPAKAAWDAQEIAKAAIARDAQQQQPQPKTCPHCKAPLAPGQYEGAECYDCANAV